MTKKMTHRERFERLFGAGRVGDKMAMVFRVHPATAYRWLDGEWSETAVFALELLEECPRPKWPANARAALAIKDSRNSA